LQALHVAAVVLLADEGTAIVVPFEDYILPAIVREVNGFAIAGCAREVGRWRAYFRGRE